MESLQGGRPENQDFMGFADTPLGFAMVLCDGMGGGPGGRTASTTVVEIVIRTLMAYKKGDNVTEAIKQSIAQADRYIGELTGRRQELNGMGTTVVLLIVNSQSAHVAHVGDSRLYQFRFGKNVFRTEDHSYVGELVRQGTLTEEQARLAPNSNVITRAINGRGIAIPDIVELPYERGDRFVLCTDGIWGSMPENALMKALNGTKNITKCVTQMALDVDKIGRENGGKHDNLSLAIIETTTDSKLKVKMGRRHRTWFAVLLALLAISLTATGYMAKTQDGNLQEKENVMDSLRNKNEAFKKDTANLRQQIRVKDDALNVATASERKRMEKYFQKEKEIQELKNQIESLQNNVARLNEENKNLKTEAKPKTNVGNGNDPVPAEIKTAIHTLDKWIKTIDPSNNANIIKDSDIQDVVTDYLSKKNYKKNSHIKKAIAELNKAKQEYNSRGNDKYDKQKNHLQNAKKELEKYNN